MAKKTGFYHPTDAEPKQFSVLAEHEDGTVSIGTEATGAEGKDTVVVKNCPVAKTAKAGHFTLGAKVPKAKGEPEPEPETEELKVPDLEKKTA